MAKRKVKLEVAPFFFEKLARDNKVIYLQLKLESIPETKDYYATICQGKRYDTAAFVWKTKGGIKH